MFMNIKNVCKKNEFKFFMNTKNIYEFSKFMNLKRKKKKKGKQ